MSEPWDLAVVGAGPAGAAAALSALRTRPGARVLLLDRAGFPRDKSCGDGVAPHAQDELALLGVPDLLADRVPVRRPDVVVPRTELDARLVDAAVDAGAVLVRHQVRELEVRDGLVVLDGRLRARAVVGADGANGVVRRLLARRTGAPHRQPDQALAVAVRGYAAAPAGEPEQLIVMDDQGWPAYAWSFGAGDGTANVGFGMLLPRLRDAQAAQGRSGREVLHGRLRELLPGVEAERLISHHLPLSTARPTSPPGPVLLAGDALSLINPLTGEGIYYALASGRLAGRAAVTAADPGTAYATALRRELGRHLRHTTLLARLTERSGVVDAGIAAADRSPRAFDALVELGLGRGLITPPLLAGMAREVCGRAVRRFSA